MVFGPLGEWMCLAQSLVEEEVFESLWGTATTPPLLMMGRSVRGRTGCMTQPAQTAHVRPATWWFLCAVYFLFWMTFFYVGHLNSAWIIIDANRFETHGSLLCTNPNLKVFNCLINCHIAKWYFAETAWRSPCIHVWPLSGEGSWSDWSSSPCSNSCGAGTRMKTRQCTTSNPQCCLGNTTMIENCVGECGKMTLWQCIQDQYFEHINVYFNKHYLFSNLT